MDVNRKELAAILGILKEAPQGMAVSEISKAVAMNRHSAAKYLEVLVAAGHVDMKAFGPSKIYYISQRVPISAMLSFSSDLILTLDKYLRVRSVNDRFLEFTGLGRDEVLNKNVKNFSGAVRTEPLLLPYIEAALGGAEGAAEVFYTGRSGSYYFTLKALPTVFEDGENGATLILGDITARRLAEEALRLERAELEVRVKERTAELESANRKLKAEIEQRSRSERALRESEEKYRNLVENVSDWIWETDLLGLFTYSSPKVFDILGYRPEEILGLRTIDLMTPENAQKLSEKMATLALEGVYPPVLETELLHKGGRAVSLEVKGQPMYNRQGTAIGFRGVARDVTARLQAVEVKTLR